MRRFLLFTAAALVLAAPAHAAGPAFGIRAVGKWKLGYFVFDGKPGTTLTGKILVSNNGDRAGDVHLFATDATTGQTSGTVYETSGERPTDVGKWVKLPATTLNLGPKEHRIVPFSVVVPRGARSGTHVGGIVAETAQQATSSRAKGKTNVQVTVRNLAIVAVQVDLPGKEIASIHIGKVTVGGRRGFQQVFIRITNTGNVLLRPGMAVHVTNDAGDVLLAKSLKLDTILPHTSIDYPVTVTGKAIPAGSYHGDVQLAYAGKQTTAAPTVSVTPEQVQQVFTSAGPTQAPPTAAPAPVGSKKSGGISPIALVLAAIAAISLLVAVWFAATARARKSG